MIRIFLPDFRNNFVNTTQQFSKLVWSLKLLQIYWENSQSFVKCFMFRPRRRKIALQTRSIKRTLWACIWMRDDFKMASVPAPCIFGCLHLESSKLTLQLLYPKVLDHSHFLVRRTNVNKQQTATHTFSPTNK